MLIFNFTNKIEKKFTIRRRKKQNFKTSGFICNNIVFNVIELSKANLDDENIIELLNMHRGFVLETSDAYINKKISEYLFDYTPYLKRALLSGLVNACSAQRQPALRIFDNNFRFSIEWTDLAALCKKIIIIGAENNDMRLFQRYCLNELGLNVFLNEDIVSNEFITVNLNSIGVDKYITTQGRVCERILPDKRFFACDEASNKLISFGVSPEVACAAVQVVPFKKIYSANP